MSRRSGVILLVSAAVLLVAGLLLYRYIPDDAFITLRYARNVASGAGFVFNEGERVEGYTNFLWLLLLAAAGRLGLPLVGAARALSLLCAVGTLALTAKIAAARAVRRAAGAGGGPAGNGAWPAAAAPVLLLAAAPTTAVWALSGTEIPLFTLLLMAGVLQIERGAQAWRVMLPLGVLGLVRPDGLLFFAAAGLLLLVRGNGRPDERACAGPVARGEVVLAGLVVLLVVFAPYLLWKQRYFGELLPNTWYAKTGPPGLLLANGARYLRGFLFAYGWLLPAGLLLGGERLVRESRGLLLLVFAHWGAVAALGGDWMPHFRLLYATVPLAAILFAEGLFLRTAPWRSAAAAPRNGEAPPVVGERRRAPDPAPILLALAASLLMVYAGATWERFRTERLVVTNFGHVGVRLAEALPPTARIACGSTGAIGWFSRLPIVDLLGLTEPAIAREGRIVSTQPGHMKANGRYVIGRRPDLLLLGNVWIHRGHRPERDLPLKIQERDIAEQPDFARLYVYDEMPVGGGFFLSFYRLREDAR
ncbi:MAG: hypothetical protein JW876_00020 [Candidatus Krumholzibacteriota bacterium]|nr:hypothetical protein [Candidatus Krumholzibacteriota bacterium]